MWASRGTVQGVVKGKGDVETAGHADGGAFSAYITGHSHSSKSGTYWTDERLSVYARGGNQLASLPRPDGVWDLVMSPAGDRIALAAAQRTKASRIEVCTRTGGRVFSHSTHDPDAFATLPQSRPLGFLPDGSLVAVTELRSWGASDATFFRLSPDGEHVEAFHEEDAMESMATTRSCSHIAVSDGTGVVKVLRPDGTSLGSAPLNGTAFGLGISADGSRVVAATRKKTLVAFEVAP